MTTIFISLSHSQRLVINKNDPHRFATANRDANKSKNRYVNVLPCESLTVTVVTVEVVLMMSNCIVYFIAQQWALNRAFSRRVEYTSQLRLHCVLTLYAHWLMCSGFPQMRQTGCAWSISEEWMALTTSMPATLM